MLDRLEVEAWLAAAVQGLQPTIVKAQLFGSILDPEATPSDVDILLVFEGWDVRNPCSLLKRQFEERFGHPLHIQMFHGSQTEDLEAFLMRAGESRRFV